MSWNERAEKRFNTLSEAHDFTEGLRSRCHEADVPVSLLRFVDDGGHVQMLDPTSGNKYDLTNWSFGQVAHAAGAHTSYLRKLSSKLAVDCLNYHFETSETEKTARLYLCSTPGGHVVRGFNTPRYGRFHDSGVVRHAQRLEEQGWKAKDIRCSDKAIYIKLVDDNGGRVIDDGSEGGLKRAVIVRNSEVGFSKYCAEALYERLVCANGLRVLQAVWEANVRHIGAGAGDRIEENFEQFLLQVQSMDPAQDIALVKKAMKMRLGETRKETVENTYRKRIDPFLTKKVLETAWHSCVMNERYLNPNSIYGLVQGITRESQQLPAFEDRTRLDAAAGRLMDHAAKGEPSEADLAAYSVHPAGGWE